MTWVARWTSVASAVGLLLVASCATDAGDSSLSTPATVGPTHDADTRAQAGGFSIEITNDVFMSFVLVPAGTFLMGSADGEATERPVHAVTIAQPFYLGTTEVTQAQWKAVMHENPSFNQGDDLPVDSVLWNECEAFLARLNSSVGGERFALPTEAQWEYACRAGSQAAWCFGDDEGVLSDYAWFEVNSADRTHPVAQKRPNAFGLYDMHGNVWEWCADVWRSDYGGTRSEGQSPAPASSSQHAFRGGCVADEAGYTRSAYRTTVASDRRINDLGFRVARFATEEPKRHMR
jgi:formylglycine-generating enzyme required for sulfatase activity